jgi:hypothetical protein
MKVKEIHLTLTPEEFEDLYYTMKFSTVLESTIQKMEEIKKRLDFVEQRNNN